MIKVVALLTKRPGLSLAEFDSHWHKPHGDPLTLNIVTIRHAVQNARLPAADDLTDAPFHGIPEVWLDDVEAALNLGTAPGYAAAEADQSRFMDVERTRFLITEEEAPNGEVGPGDGRGVKLIQLVRGTAGLSSEAFHTAWNDPADWERSRAVGAIRHVLSRCVPQSYAAARPPFDGLRELWFDNLDALRHAARRQPYTWRALFTPACVDPAASVSYVAVERRLR